MTAPTPYAAHLRVGAHEWDVSSADAPAYGPLAGVRFSWAARQDDGWPTQHDPTLLVFGVIVSAGEDMADVDQGTAVHFTFTPDGYAAPLVTFGGTVRDLTGRPHPLGMVYEITAVDHLQKLQEDYATALFLASGSPLADLWPQVVSSGAGLGTSPALPDPFAGDVLPGSIAGAFLGDDVDVQGSTWAVMTGILATQTFKAGATPFYQRGVLTYQLDASGDLDATHPFEGTWLPQGNANAPLELVEGPDGWTTGGGNVDGSLVDTASAQWARQRVEPNRVEDTATGLSWERAHTGPDVVRAQAFTDYLSGWTEPVWVVAGLENPDQWGTALVVRAARDPELVAGWFTLPTAMRVAVVCHGIDPRHTPNGSGQVAGMLAGAALVIPPGGDWVVAFSLRRTLPDPDAAGTGGWAAAADATTFATVDPAVTLANLDPALTIRDLTFL